MQRSINEDSENERKDRFSIKTVLIVSLRFLQYRYLLMDMQDQDYWVKSGFDAIWNHHYTSIGLENFFQ